METSVDSSSNVDLGSRSSQYFTDSTHFFLYYPNHQDSTTFAKILGAVTLLLQFGLYGVLIYSGIQNLSSNYVNVVINEDNCQDETEKDRIDLSDLDSLSLNCETDNAVDSEDDNLRNASRWFAGILAFYFLVAFMLPDVLMLFKAFKTHKYAFIVSIMLLIEVFVAIFAAQTYIVIGFDTGINEGIFGSVSVIFVHELDEAFKKGIDILIKDRNKPFWIVVLPLLILPFIFVVIGSILTFTVFASIKNS